MRTPFAILGGHVMWSREESKVAVGVGTHRNRLLSALPPAELDLIEPQLEAVELERRELLYDPDRPIGHVYFIEQGIASVLSVLSDGSAVETATIGFEGFIGLPVFHGVERTSEQAMMQVPGWGLRLPAGEFRRLIGQLPTLSLLLHRFAAFMFTLAAQNSACNRKHAVEQRCARWILTVHDRMDSDDIGLTHDFISQMLGVRRASVTETLSALERQGFITTGRSRLTVTDRSGLERVACACYHVVRASSDRLLEGAKGQRTHAGVETSRDGFSTVGDGTPQASSLDEPVGLAELERGRDR